MASWKDHPAPHGGSGRHDADQIRMLLAVGASIVLHGLFFLATSYSAGSVGQSVRGTRIEVSLLNRSTSRPAQVALAQTPALPPAKELPKHMVVPGKPLDQPPQPQSVLPALGPIAIDPRPNQEARAAGTGGVLLPGVRYFTSRELERPPTLLHPIALEYPAKADGLNGSVVLRLLIDDKGHIDDITVVDTTAGDVFNESALHAFRAAKYAPGMVAGFNVRSQILVQISYSVGNGNLQFQVKDERERPNSNSRRPTAATH